jgi:GR25 family glycosyltransferase involved in LPS biosynthesis
MYTRFNALGIDHQFSEGIDTVNRAHSIMESHLFLIKKFLESENTYGIICEDDIFIHKDFKNLVGVISNEFDERKLDIVLLGYLINNIPELFGTFKFQSDGLSYYDYPDFLWGAHCYMISRGYASELLDTYNFEYAIQNEVYSPDWLITKKSPKRCFVYPPLAVEEGEVNTTDEGQVWFHRSCKNFLFNESYI